MVERTEGVIIAGQLEVFPGMTDEDLRGIDWFESNTVGELPWHGAWRPIARLTTVRDRQIRREVS